MQSSQIRPEQKSSNNSNCLGLDFPTARFHLSSKKMDKLRHRVRNITLINLKVVFLIVMGEIHGTQNSAYSEITNIDKNSFSKK